MKEETMPLIMKLIVWLNLEWQWRYLTDKTGFLFIGMHCIVHPKECLMSVNTNIDLSSVFLYRSYWNYHSVYLLCRFINIDMLKWKNNFWMYSMDMVIFWYMIYLMFELPNYSLYFYIIYYFILYLVRQTTKNVSTVNRGDFGHPKKKTYFIL